MKKLVFLVGIAQFSILSIDAQVKTQKNCIEPYVGVFAGLPLDSREFEMPASLFGIALYHNISDLCGIGIKGACLISYAAGFKYSWSGALSLSYELKENILANIDIGILPGFGFSINNHHINLGFFPLLSEPNSSIPRVLFVSVTYGYRVPF